MTTKQTSKRAPVRIVVLTNDGSAFGRLLLAELAKHSVPLVAYVRIKQPFMYHVKLFKSVVRRTNLFDACVLAIKRIWNQAINNSAPKYSSFSYRSLVSKGTNSIETATLLRKLKPDVVLLGQTGIIKDELLSIPRLATFNAHPGILPNYRGIDCARWAIFHDDCSAVGVTVHTVNSGVDTGEIVRKVKYLWTGTETLAEIDRTLDSMAVTALCDVIVSGQYTGEFAPQDRSAGKQYYKMGLVNERRARRNLKRYQSQLGRGNDV